MSTAPLSTASDDRRWYDAKFTLDNVQCLTRALWEGREAHLTDTQRHHETDDCRAWRLAIPPLAVHLGDRLPTQGEISACSLCVLPDHHLQHCARSSSTPLGCSRGRWPGGRCVRGTSRPRQLLTPKPNQAKPRPSTTTHKRRHPPPHAPRPRRCWHDTVSWAILSDSKIGAQDAHFLPRLTLSPLTLARMHCRLRRTIAARTIRTAAVSVHPARKTNHGG
jgi:hypothetical protein